MFFCQNCGKPLRENAKFCHICGAEQSLNEYEEAPRREDPKMHEPQDRPVPPEDRPVPLEDRPAPPQERPAPPKVIHLPPVREPAAPPEQPGDGHHDKPADEKPPKDRPAPADGKPPKDRPDPLENCPTPPENGQKTFSVKCTSLELDCKFEDGTGTLTIRFR